MKQSSSSYVTISARWVLPVAEQPLQYGQITVKNARIESIGPARGQRADLHFDDCALIPGLVNIHTHLDLSGMKNLSPPSADFVSWLRSVVAHRRTASAAQTDAAIRAGLEACIRAGTTLVADVSGGGASWSVLAEAPIRSVVLYEILGLSNQRADEAHDSVTTWLAQRPVLGGCRPGLSPHAPYSVHTRLFQQANALARAYGLVLATHLAESPAELELLENRRGPFVPFLQDLGVWNPDGLATSPQEVLAACTQDGVRTLVVHGNYLPPDTPLSPRSTLVYCPRTHAAFGHPRHPFRDFLARGVRVALGTDSLASNPDLDMLAEARFVRRSHPDLPGAQLLRMITLSGTEALGFDEETGSLEPGKSADLAVVPLPNRDGDPHDLLFDSAEAVRAVMCRGQWIHGEVA
jgi:cytosine/adenosine deaminase-related metal-dependent hydrolase